MTHQVITNPFDIGYNEEEILKVSQLFIQYCKAFKISCQSPSYYKNNREAHNSYRESKNWEQALNESRLLALTSKELARDTSKHTNMRMGDHKALSPIVDEMASVLRSDKYESVTNSGMFWYPPTGFMGWHTNASSPCDRLYIVYSSTGESFFRYYDNETKEIVTDYDRAGLTWRLFPVTNEPPHFWHCVGSNCDRISCGFRLDYKKINWKKG